MLSPRFLPRRLPLLLHSCCRPLSTTSNTNPSSTSPHPPATSTSAAQPFSTPYTPAPLPPSPSPSPSVAEQTPARGQDPAKSTRKSKTPAGTPLRIGYLKNQPPLLAREDSAYPDWLWGLLDEDTGAGAGAGKGGKEAGEEGGDAFSKSKKQRRKAARLARRRGEVEGAQRAVKVPVQRQSVDLPAAGEEALRAREGLTGAMRRERRGKIKEGNFLRGMK